MPACRSKTLQEFVDGGSAIAVRLRVSFVLENIIEQVAFFHEDDFIFI